MTATGPSSDHAAIPRENIGAYGVLHQGAPSLPARSGTAECVAFRYGIDAILSGLVYGTRALTQGSLLSPATLG
jgi:hypothetical protein